MKRMILTIVAVGFASALSAQLTAYDYIKKAPSVPAKVCELQGPQQDAFLNTVNDLSDLIHKDIKRQTDGATEYARNHEDEMKTGIMRNAGVSESDMQKMKNGKDMTEAEKKEMADRMMKEKTNISMDEAKNLQNMSKEGKEAWAQGYAAEQMAVAQSNPQQNQAGNDKNRSLYELLSEQSTLRNKITGDENTIRQKYQVIDRDAEAAKAILEIELKPLYEELNSINDGEGSTQADVDHAARVMKQIHAKQDKFCEKFTPLMLDFLVQCRKSYETNIPDYDRMEQIQFEVTAAQTGTDKLSVGKGVYSLQAVEQYLGYLKEAFRYKLYRIE